MTRPLLLEVLRALTRAPDHGATLTNLMACEDADTPTACECGCGEGHLATSAIHAADVAEEGDQPTRPPG